MRSFNLKSVLIKVLHAFYVLFPVPHGIKRRVKGGLAERLPLVGRISQAARRQALLRHVSASVSVEQAAAAARVEAQSCAVPTSVSQESAVIDEAKARAGTLVSASRRSISYVSEVADSFGETPPPVRAMAFYLPQFHPIKENDEWWGKGFTEWTNVARARPQVEGQWQPHLPGELGFYDLRTPGVMRRQAELALAHGVQGFCFYFYWFAGKRLLERPILDFVADKSIDMSFSLCWANENWTRRWDGFDADILIGQAHSPEDDLAFIEYVCEYMKHSRYVRIGGRPLLTVYRPSLLPDPAATANRWRKRCRELGIGEIYLALTLSFDNFEPASIGFDGALEFPPNNTFPPNITDRVLTINPGYEGQVYDWRAMVERSKSYPEPRYDLFRGVCPSWDNEARKSGRGTVLMHSSPRRYQEWLENAAKDTIRRFKDHDRRLVFINAWNEWAEGAHLEPDARFGYAYLQATRRALLRAAEPDHGNKRLPERITVVIHAYYPELLSEILEQLHGWDVPYRVIVTTEHAKVAEVSRLLQRWNPDAECIGFENKGRDILPFLKVLGELLSADEKLILKLHTKKSLHRDDGEAWRKDLLGKLATPAQARRIFESFRAAPNLSLVAPEGHVVSMDTYWGSNAATVQYLCRRLDVPMPVLEAAAFPAGSMFYLRPDVLGPLLDLHLDEAEFEPEAGQVDGTMPHAIERVFGILATQNHGILAASNEPATQFAGFHKNYEYAKAEV
jgi:lipopolysaccharide biosynthesis protein